jgi:hypothetical protein
MAKEQLLCDDVKQLLDSSSLSVLKVRIYGHDFIVMFRWRCRDR